MRTEYQPSINQHRRDPRTRINYCGVTAPYKFNKLAYGTNKPEEILLTATFPFPVTSNQPYYKKNVSYFNQSEPRLDIPKDIPTAKSKNPQIGYPKDKAILLGANRVDLNPVFMAYRSCGGEIPDKYLPFDRIPDGYPPGSWIGIRHSRFADWKSEGAGRSSVRQPPPSSRPRICEIARNPEGTIDLRPVTGEIGEGRGERRREEGEKSERAREKGNETRQDERGRRRGGGGGERMMRGPPELALLSRPEEGPHIKSTGASLLPDTYSSC